MAFASGVRYWPSSVSTSIAVSGADRHVESLTASTSVPSNWLLNPDHQQKSTVRVQCISRPSSSWRWCRHSTNLRLLMGDSDWPGIMRRFVELIRMKKPQLDQQVARKLVSTYIHFRVREINSLRGVNLVRRRSFIPSGVRRKDCLPVSGAVILRM